MKKITADSKENLIKKIFNMQREGWIQTGNRGMVSTKDKIEFYTHMDKPEHPKQELPSPELLQKMLANFGKVVTDLDNRVRVLEKKTENLP